MNAADGRCNTWLCLGASSSPAEQKLPPSPVIFDMADIHLSISIDDASLKILLCFNLLQVKVSSKEKEEVVGREFF